MDLFASLTFVGHTGHGPNITQLRPICQTVFLIMASGQLIMALDCKNTWPITPVIASLYKYFAFRTTILRIMFDVGRVKW